MQVLLNLPDPYFSLYDQPALVREIQLSLALVLFKNSKISITKAAHIANLDLYEFMSECRKNEISVININSSDLEKEWNEIKEGLQ